MQYIFLSFFLFVMAFVLMAIGVVCGKGFIKGSCGSVDAAMGRDCGSCSCDKNPAVDIAETECE